MRAVFRKTMGVMAAIATMLTTVITPMPAAQEGSSEEFPAQEREIFAEDICPPVQEAFPESTCIQEWEAPSEGTGSPAQEEYDSESAQETAKLYLCMENTGGKVSVYSANTGESRDYRIQNETLIMTQNGLEAFPATDEGGRALAWAGEPGSIVEVSVTADPGFCISGYTEQPESVPAGDFSAIVTGEYKSTVILGEGARTIRVSFREALVPPAEEEVTVPPAEEAGPVPEEEETEAFTEAVTEESDTGSDETFIREETEEEFEPETEGEAVKAGTGEAAEPESEEATDIESDEKTEEETAVKSEPESKEEPESESQGEPESESQGDLENGSEEAPEAGSGVDSGEKSEEEGLYI